MGQPRGVHARGDRDARPVLHERCDKYNCISFTSQAEAKEALAANAPGDPNRMNMNANGVACEDIAYPPTAPRKLTPISNR